MQMCQPTPLQQSVSINLNISPDVNAQQPIWKLHTRENRVLNRRYRGRQKKSIHTNPLEQINILPHIANNKSYIDSYFQVD
jgi:hypothetical protein